MRSIVLLFFLSLTSAFCQDRPINGLAPSQPMVYLLKNAHIIVSPDKTLSKASLLIEGDKIVEIGTFILKPANAIEVDCEGKTIVPAFIELNSEIGIQKLPFPAQKSPYPQLESTKTGEYYWNESIHPETQAAASFSPDEKANELWTKMGFGFALSHTHDGIARGTGVLISLGKDDVLRSQLITAQASAHFSLDKGSSHQSYPSSQMGVIALLRQTLYDLEWYRNQTNKSPNLSMDALGSQLDKPLFFETGDALEILRAHAISTEFNLPFHYIGSGNEYQIIDQLKTTQRTVVIPLKFPKAYDVTDPYINMEIPLSELKHWELAPSNAYLLSRSGIPFCFSASGVSSEKEFWSNVHLALKRGLTPSQALAALTTVPAKLLGESSRMGTLEKNKLASFFIYDSNPFDGAAQLTEKWMLGSREIVKELPLSGIPGQYDFLVDNKSIPIEINQKGEKFTAKFIGTGVKKDENPIHITFENNDVVVQFSDSLDGFKGSVNLHGKINTRVGVMEGEGTLPSGRWVKWSAIKRKKLEPEKPESKPREIDSTFAQRIWFPCMAYGYDSLPQQQTFVIKNVTAWTNESQGILKNATVIVENGKIRFIGDGGYRTPNGAIEIDGKGMHLTSGIIDEHSHIAISKGVNEGGQAISAEVSIGDVVRNDDINIYRQLAGGVTASQLLHGSANPIGGQSALIKLKWGFTPQEMLIKDAPKFIKFALGENVKQTNWGDFNTIRFPQTRMGVEQVYMDAFTRALAYQDQKRSSTDKKNAVRRDLELDVLSEILNKERFITCHSYVQSEINMLLHVADTFGFKINTFTHILEGYKVADKLAAHGAGGSTFSDWWAYKYEVRDAIPYNAKLMVDQGVVVAINSDDAEMGRRLNQEAAKAVKYGGMAEEDAWKMVTLNPAKLLHLDDRMGSIREGKDADLVLWTTHPLSVEAIADKVFIDGILHYDRMQDVHLQLRNQNERARILSEMAKAARNGAETKNFERKEPKYFHCDTLGEEGSSETNTH